MVDAILKYIILTLAGMEKLAYIINLLVYERTNE